MDIELKEVVDLGGWEVGDRASALAWLLSQQNELT